MLLLAGLLLLAPPAAHAHETADLVLVVVRPDGGEGIADLETALAAHLSCFDVEVRQRAVAALSSAPRSQAEEVRALVEESGARAAIWTDNGGGTIFVLIARRQAEEQILARPMGEAATGELDAVASMIRSALAPVLRSPGNGSERAASDAPPPRQLGDGELPPFAVVSLEEEVAPRPPAPAVLYARAGYAPLLATGSTPVEHGGQLGLGAMLLDHLELELAVDFVEPLQGRAPYSDITLTRWPLRGFVGGYLTVLGSLDLALRVGVVVDFIEVSGVDAANLADDTSYVVPGFASGAAVRYRVTGWLALWLEGGADLYRTAYDFTKHDQESLVIRYAPVQGRLFFGLAATFEVG